ncbi:hypothetical protein JW964_13110 [candidate division KSB1 bacterium]|nr:hypothetical protein [candidate division KSB1 bacterium]
MEKELRNAQMGKKGLRLVFREPRVVEIDPHEFKKDPRVVEIDPHEVKKDSREVKKDPRVVEKVAHFNIISLNAKKSD